MASPASCASLLALPDEVLLLVLALLEQRDLCTLRQTCRRFGAPRKHGALALVEEAARRRLVLLGGTSRAAVLRGKSGLAALDAADRLGVESALARAAEDASSFSHKRTSARICRYKSTSEALRSSGVRHTFPRRLSRRGVFSVGRDTAIALRAGTLSSARFVDGVDLSAVLLRAGSSGTHRWEPVRGADATGCIEEVACGWYHVLVRARSGSVFAWGAVHGGRLAIASLLDPPRAPQRVTALEGIDIAFLAAGGLHSACVDRNGSLYVWGNNAKGQLGVSDSDFSPVVSPSQVPFDAHVVHVSCGCENTAICTSVGEVFVAGNAAQGQAGPPASHPSGFSARFVRVELSPGTRICRVAVGDGHILALSILGDVWCWGKNQWGQCATQRTRQWVTEPVRAVFPGGDTGCGVQVVAIAANERSSAAVTATGSFAVWGAGQRTSATSFACAPAPTFVPGRHDRHVVDIAGCGETFVVVLRNGAYVCWRTGKMVAVEESDASGRGC